VNCPTPIRWEKTTAVAVKIKLKRLGKIRAPYYRIVIADSRTKRDGRAIEEIGKYHPKAEPSFIEVNSERAQHWLSVGAQPTDPVRKILEITGDWQKFKGLPGAEGTLRTAEPKADRKVAFAAAVAENLTETGAKSKPKGRADAKAGDAKAGDAKAGDAKAGDAKAGGTKAAEKATGAKADKAPARAKKAAATPAAAADTPAEAPEAAAETAESPAAEAESPEAAGEATQTAAPAEPSADEAAAADAAATAEAKAEAIAEVAEDSAPIGEAEGDGA
jgi:small subunit ribosomal protein S16